MIVENYMTENEIKELSIEEEQRLYELYLDHCKQAKINGSLRDFIIFLQER